MASKHIYLSHTADIAFDIEADSIEELFIEAFRVWVESAAEIINYQPQSKLELEINSESLEQLLVDFLNELNFLLTVKKILCAEVEMIEIDQNKFRIKARLKTQQVNDNSILKEEIKSVTYHQMEIKNDKGKYRVRVVFDI